MKTVEKKETKKPQQPKKKRFLKISMEEIETLRTLGLRERWMYVEFRLLTNFSTGIAGDFGQTRLILEKIADFVAVPESQGRAAQTIDRAEASRIIDRLSAAGLVKEIERRKDNDGMQFRLPLTPVTEPGKLQQTGIQKREKLQQAGGLESPENPDSTRICDDWAEPPSILKYQRNNSTPINIGGAEENEAGGGYAADTTNANPSPENPNPAPQALTLPAIEKRLTAGNFNYVQTPKSLGFYERWIGANIRPEQFERAVRLVEETFELPQTPDSVDGALREIRKRRTTGRGRVAL